MGDLRRALHFHGRGVGCPERDVLRDGLAEQKRFLRNETNVRAQRPERNLPDGHAVHEKRPWGGVVKARNQAGERGLARPGGAHNGHGFSGGNVQVDIFQDRLAIARLRGRVAEREVAELDFAANGLDRALGNVAIVNVGPGVENPHEPAERGEAPLDEVRHPAERDDGPDQIDQVNVECRERAERDAPGKHVLPAHEHQEHEGHREQKAEGRPQEAGNPDQALVLLDELLVHAVELGFLGFFLAEGTDNLDSREVLAHPLGKLGVHGLDFFEALVNPATEDAHHDRAERERGDDDERQTPV